MIQRMIRRFLHWLWLPSAEMIADMPACDAMDGLGFRRSDYRRRHEHIEEIPGIGRRRWNSICMYWEVLDANDRVIGMICPDHERPVIIEITESVFGRR